MGTIFADVLLSMASGKISANITDHTPPKQTLPVSCRRSVSAHPSTMALDVGLVAALNAIEGVN